ncbi:hypothetical protein AWENTII_002302 [Aspergillus wentii]
MGLQAHLALEGSATVQDAPYAKEPDASYQPRENIPGRDSRWPSVVVEAGLSEGLGRLRIDAQWWLLRSRGQVKLAIVISVNRNEPRILFEQWEAYSGPSRSGHDLRSDSRGELRAERTHRITITHQLGTTTTVGDPLVIPFRSVFLRDPANAVEQDFVLTRADLELIAGFVWEAQGFIQKASR